MSQVVSGNKIAARTADLRAALEGSLTQHFKRPFRVVRLQRRLSNYRSSFSLEELDLELDDGTTLELVFKDLSRQALLDEARLAKPPFLYDPLREIDLYQTVLDPERLGTAVCYGSVVDHELGRYWLFLERVPGERLRYVGDLSIWEQATHHLAGLHNHFADRPELLAGSRPRLSHYDRGYYELWLGRALEFVHATGGNLLSGDSHRLKRLAGNYGRVIERLLALPVTLIHAEYYPANVLIHERGPSLRICPVDWETAGVGPGLIDLAALTAGDWTEQQRTALAMSYYRQLARGPTLVPSWEEFLTALDCCEMHLAVQWLGWSAEWSPPPEEARNWLGDALRLADKLGL